MSDFDLIVIGAGPGGYVAAIRAAQLGLTVACVEKEAVLGGTCVRVGCIPSKVLLESSERYAMARDHLAEHGVQVGEVTLDLATMMERKDAVVKSNTDGVAYLFKKHGIERVTGTGELKGRGHVVVHGPDGEERELHAEHVILATGSRVAPLQGVEVDGERVITSDHAIALDEVPKHLVVIGAGVIGLELGSVWSRLGAKVTVLEYLDRVLPTMDEEISREAKKIFTKQGLDLRTGVAVTGTKRTKQGVTVQLADGDPVKADVVLLATGRLPNTEGLGLEAAGVAMTERGFVVVDERFATSLEGVYAIGDLIHGPMLAHKAEDDGVAVVEQLVTGHGHVDYDLVPNVVYTEPEVASVGKTERELEEAGVPYRKGVFPYQANGRARALGATDGKVKLLAHKETDRLLGAHVIGARAGDLIAELVAAMAFGASSEDVARLSHAHPTLAEIVKEAALAVDGRALHI